MKKNTVRRIVIAAASASQKAETNNKRAETTYCVFLHLFFSP
ncbi:MAG: hypothetical protein ACKO1E_03120 [Acidimicrobiaceae bacterium]